MRCEVSSASRRQGATSGAGSAVPSGVLEWNFVRPPCSGASVALVLLLLLLLLPLTVHRWARLRSPFCSFLSSSRPPGPNHSSLPFLPFLSSLRFGSLQPPLLLIGLLHLHANAPHPPRTHQHRRLAHPCSPARYTARFSTFPSFVRISCTEFRSLHSCRLHPTYNAGLLLHLTARPCHEFRPGTSSLANKLSLAIGHQSLE